MPSDDLKMRITDVADTLVNEGNESPTNTVVRERLGGGSLSDIAPVMRKWREDRRNKATAVLAMPSELKQSVEQSLSQVWTTASKLAGVEVNRVKNEAQKRINVISVEHEEAMVEIQRLEKLLENRDAEIKHLTNDNRSISSNMHKLEANNVALSSRLKAIEEQVSMLQGQLKETHTQNHELIKSLGKQD